MRNAREVKVTHPQAAAKLKEAEDFYREEKFDQALLSARQALSYQRASAAWKVIANCYCQKGDLGGVNSALPHLSASQRRAVVDLCHQHNVDLD